MQRYYQAVWKTRKVQDMVLIKTLLYTGVRVSELVNIQLLDVDFERCQIRINSGKGGKDRIVPFPVAFKEVLAMHVDRMEQLSATYLFESSWKRKYTDQGIRKILAKYAEAAGLRARGATEQKLTLSSFKLIALGEITPLRATVKGRKLNWVCLGKLCLKNI
jgi:integrase/recombinase XerD